MVAVVQMINKLDGLDFGEDDEEVLAACASRIGDVLSESFKELQQCAERFSSTATYVGRGGGVDSNANSMTRKSASSVEPMSTSLLLAALPESQFDDRAAQRKRESPLKEGSKESTPIKRESKDYSSPPMRRESSKDDSPSATIVKEALTTPMTHASSVKFQIPGSKEASITSP